MLKFKSPEKGQGIVSLSHFEDDFYEKNVSHVTLY